MSDIRELITTLNQEFPQCQWYYDSMQDAKDPAIECNKHQRFLSKKFFQTPYDLNEAIRREIRENHAPDKFQIVIP